MEITWDFIRQVSPAATPGSTVLYYDMSAQAFYIANNAIMTKKSVATLSQWEQHAYGDEIQVSDTGYSVLDVEHHFNDAVFATAYHNGDVVFLVYEYRIDTSELIDVGILQLQPNNSIKVATLELSKTGEARLRDSVYSMFSPGTKLDLKLRVGSEDPVAIERLTFADMSWDEIRSKTTLVAKNIVALSLLNQTFDDQVTYTGTVAEIVAAILTAAGITGSQVAANTTATTVTFESDQTFLDGLSDFCALYGWYVDSSSDDVILVGDDAFIQTFKQIVIHNFTRDDDVFSRYLYRGIKHIYSRVCVRRKGSTPLQLYGTVPTFDYAIPAQKTFYKDVAESVTDAEMATIRDNLVANMQYSGIEETFTSAFRPTLKIGDGVIITAEDASTQAGILIDVQHVFGNEGYFTQFTMCCGGTMANNPPTLTSLFVTRLGYLDRKQQLLKYLNSSDRR